LVSRKSTRVQGREFRACEHRLASSGIEIMPAIVTGSDDVDVPVRAPPQETRQLL
jgi:hypothetical protein